MVSQVVHSGIKYVKVTGVKYKNTRNTNSCICKQISIDCHNLVISKSEIYFVGILSIEDLWAIFIIFLFY